MSDRWKVRYGTVNCAWQLGGDVRLLRTASSLVDVLQPVECRDKDMRPIDVAAILGPEWMVRQTLTDDFGRPSSALAGSAIAVRKSAGIVIHNSRLIKLSEPGKEVQARYQRITVLREPSGWVTEAAAGHIPLLGTGRQDDAMKRVAAWRQAAGRRRNDQRLARREGERLWIWQGDANMPLNMFASRIDAPHHYGSNVMVSAWSTGWGPVDGRAVRVPGSDHPMVIVTAGTRE